MCIVGGRGTGSDAGGKTEVTSAAHEMHEVTQHSMPQFEGTP